MITVKVIFNDGSNFKTEFNGTVQDAHEYYFGKMFVDDLNDGTEVSRTVSELIVEW